MLRRRTTAGDNFLTSIDNSYILNKLGTYAITQTDRLYIMSKASKTRLQFISYYLLLLPLALEVLLSRGRGKICVTIPTSGRLRSPDPFLVIAAYIMRIMHFTSVKVTWRPLNNSSFPLASIDTVARSTFVNVLTSFK